MSFDGLHACGLLLEKTDKSRLAIARISRQLGSSMRRDAQHDDHMVALGMAMSRQGVAWAIDVAEESGCTEGVDFVSYTGDLLTGPTPRWLVVEDRLPSDPWLGLRPETWDAMEPSVREYWEALRLKTHRVFSHVAECSPAP